MLRRSRTAGPGQPDPGVDDTDRVAAWVRVVTGMELDADGAVMLLDPAAWKRHQEHLHQTIGPPLP